MDATSNMLAIMTNDVEGLVMRVEAWQHIQEMCKVHEVVRIRLICTLEKLEPKLAGALRSHPAESVEVFWALEKVESRAVIQSLAGNYEQSFI